MIGERSEQANEAPSLMRNKHYSPNSFNLTLLIVIIVDQGTSKLLARLLGAVKSLGYYV